ncbi:MAG: hypothetical protein C5B49_01855 [Bdellovibrio sp.]|nr:MAG: hypothetical protein C5B49_01855 [Bdellovibrio sp.]
MGPHVASAEVPEAPTWAAEVATALPTPDLDFSAPPCEPAGSGAARTRPEGHSFDVPNDRGP